MCMGSSKSSQHIQIMGDKKKKNNSAWISQCFALKATCLSFHFQQTLQFPPGSEAWVCMWGFSLHAQSSPGQLGPWNQSLSEASPVRGPGWSFHGWDSAPASEAPAEPPNRAQEPARWPSGCQGPRCPHCREGGRESPRHRAKDSKGSQGRLQDTFLCINLSVGVHAWMLTHLQTTLSV